MKIQMHNNNLDSTSILGAICTTVAFVMSYDNFDEVSKLVLMFISAGVGVTTIAYNIKKIKKLKDNEKS